MNGRILMNNKYLQEEIIRNKIKYTEKEDQYYGFSPYMIKVDGGGFTNLTLEHIID